MYTRLLIPIFSCENIILWRGHFNATEDSKFANLSINGGAGRFLPDIESTGTIS